VTTFSALASSSYFDDVFLVGLGVVKGDANGDGVVDLADVFYLVNFLFGNGPRPYGPVDVNSDTVVDLADVFYLINALFSGGPAPK